jgi:hypothetical protein
MTGTAARVPDQTGCPFASSVLTVRRFSRSEEAAMSKETLNAFLDTMRSSNSTDDSTRSRPGPARRGDDAGAARRGNRRTKPAGGVAPSKPTGRTRGTKGGRPDRLAMATPAATGNKPDHPDPRRREPLRRNPVPTLWMRTGRTSRCWRRKSALAMHSFTCRIGRASATPLKRGSFCVARRRS